MDTPCQQVKLVLRWYDPFLCLSLGSVHLIELRFLRSSVHSYGPEYSGMLETDLVEIH